MTSPVAESLNITDFDFDLPKSLIAQEPSLQRDRSRLLALNRSTGNMAHRIFTDVDQYLLPGDLLIINDTKVFPCRLPATKPGGGRAEIFLLFERGRNLWEALVKGGGTTGKRLRVMDGVEAEITGEGVDSVRTIRFHGIEDIRSILPDIGKTPLPPYIKHEADSVDRERYQTVYAVHEGAVAAPTAGLHFTGELLQRLMTKGVEIATVTLHVGPGTFQPVRVRTISEHRMLPERYSISAELRSANQSREGRRQAGDRRGDHERANDRNRGGRQQQGRARRWQLGAVHLSRLSFHGLRTGSSLIFTCRSPRSSCWCPHLPAGSGPSRPTARQ